MTHKPNYTPEVHEHADEWHHHTSSEGMPQIEHASKPNTTILLIAFAASVGFIGFTILVTYMYFGVYTRTLRAERMEDTSLAKENYLPYRAESQKILENYGWRTDEAARAGQVSIPLDKAKEKIMAKYSGGDKK